MKTNLGEIQNYDALFDDDKWIESNLADHRKTELNTLDLEKDWLCDLFKKVKKEKKIKIVL